MLRVGVLGWSQYCSDAGRQTHTALFAVGLSPDARHIPAPVVPVLLVAVMRAASHAHQDAARVLCQTPKGLEVVVGYSWS
jgi:hypothetical protein